MPAAAKSGEAFLPAALAAIAAAACWQLPGERIFEAPWRLNLGARARGLSPKAAFAPASPALIIASGFSLRAGRFLSASVSAFEWASAWPRLSASAFFNFLRSLLL